MNKAVHQQQSIEHCVKSKVKSGSTFQMRGCAACACACVQCRNMRRFSHPISDYCFAVVDDDSDKPSVPAHTRWMMKEEGVGDSANRDNFADSIVGARVAGAQPTSETRLSQ